jgi:hypothetical protein
MELSSRSCVKAAADSTAAGIETVHAWLAAFQIFVMV